jgi:hypothetical protein
MLTCKLTAGEGSGSGFVTAAPLSKGKLLRAISGAGGLPSLSGDGERSRIAGTSNMGRSMGARGNMGAGGMGAGWNMDISGSGENGGYHRGEAGGDGDRETERAKEPGLVGGVGDRDKERPRGRNAWKASE